MDIQDGGRLMGGFRMQDPEQVRVQGRQGIHQPPKTITFDPAYRVFPAPPRVAVWFSATYKT